jgi:hypothetical protein
VSNPGLPDTLVGESYSCHFDDTFGRFENITVPAIEVTPGTAYTCDITNQIPQYVGIKAGRFDATVTVHMKKLLPPFANFFFFLWLSMLFLLISILLFL